MYASKIGRSTRFHSKYYIRWTSHQFSKTPTYEYFFNRKSMMSALQKAKDAVK